MLHVLNGDATAAPFSAAGLPGPWIVWRDILMEGPPPADDQASLGARAEYLQKTLGITAGEYLHGWRAQLTSLEAAASDDEIVLWFEQDLFCSVNWWFVVSWLVTRPRPTPRLSLVCPSLDRVRGLGATAADELPALFTDRRRLDASVLELARAAWDAYTSRDPTAIDRVLAGATDAIPFLADAFRHHRARFPSVRNGLNEVEEAALRGLETGPRAFTDLFRTVGRAEPIRRHGMGDVQFAAVVRELAETPRPLLTIEATSGAATAWTVGMTELGRRVLDATIDWLDVHALDRWLGGVHLRPHAPVYRWNASQQRLLAG